MAPSSNKGSLFDLRYQLVAYASHHNNKWNILIHITCVPLILWSALVWLSNSGPLVNVYKLPATFQWLTYFGPNAAFVFILSYIAYYLMLEPVAAVMYAPILLGMSAHATHFLRTQPHANQIAVAVHVFSWIMQFIGHGAAEGRAPRLLDNLVQALVLAPFFVFFEILFALGYRPALKKLMDKDVEEDIKAWKANKAAKNK